MTDEHPVDAPGRPDQDPNRPSFFPSPAPRHDPTAPLPRASDGLGAELEPAGSAIGADPAPSGERSRRRRGSRGGRRRRGSGQGPDASSERASSDRAAGDGSSRAAAAGEAPTDRSAELRDRDATPRREFDEGPLPFEPGSSASSRPDEITPEGDRPSAGREGGAAQDGPRTGKRRRRGGRGRRGSRGRSGAGPGDGPIHTGERSHSQGERPSAEPLDPATEASASIASSNHPRGGRAGGRPGGPGVGPGDADRRPGGGQRKRRRRGGRGRGRDHVSSVPAAPVEIEAIPGEENDLPDLPELPSEAVALPLDDEREPRPRAPREERGGGRRRGRKRSERTDRSERPRTEPDREFEPASRKPARKNLILVNASDPEEQRVAVVEDGRIVDFQMTVRTENSVVNDIYRGRVVNLETAIGAAFVDFGQGKNGFLHTSDVLSAYGDKDWSLDKLLSTSLDPDEWEAGSEKSESEEHVHEGEGEEGRAAAAEGDAREREEGEREGGAREASVGGRAVSERSSVASGRKRRPEGGGGKGRRFHA